MGKNSLTRCSLNLFHWWVRIFKSAKIYSAKSKANKTIREIFSKFLRKTFPSQAFAYLMYTSAFCINTCFLDYGRFMDVITWWNLYYSTLPAEHTEAIQMPWTSSIQSHWFAKFGFKFFVPFRNKTFCFEFYQLISYLSPFLWILLPYSFIINLLRL